MNKGALIAIGVGVTAIAFVLLLFFNTSETRFGEKPRSFERLGGDFTLSSPEGDISLHDYVGKTVVLYFGFLSCPEVCPNSMGVISQALNRLSPTQLQNTQALLISVDPKRDTVDKLMEYTRFYHPNILGLTGSKSQIDAVAKKYGAYYNFTNIEKTENYGVEHSSRYYVINAKGKLVAAMRHSTTPNELYAQITQLLAKEKN